MKRNEAADKIEISACQLLLHGTRRFGINPEGAVTERTSLETFAFLEARDGASHVAELRKRKDA